MTLYEDRIAGFIEPAFFERKQQEWVQSQARVTEEIANVERANHDYFEDGVRLLELSKRAYFLFFKKRNPNEKRRLLNFVCSNSTWKDRSLNATFRVFLVTSEVLSHSIASGIALRGRSATRTSAEFLTERQLEDAVTLHLTRPRAPFSVFKERA